MSATGGVVAGKVNTAEFLDHAVDHLGDGCGVADVRWEGDCFAIASPEFLGQPV